VADWQCSAAMDVWSNGGSKFQKKSFSGPDFKQMVDGLIRSCSVEDMVLFVGLARRIWMRRNEVIHGGSFTHPDRIVSLTKQAIEDFNLAMDRGRDPVSAHSNLPSVGWKAPEVGWLKANWDAAVDEPGGRSGLGVIIRDLNGTMRAARSVAKQVCLHPEVAEAMALQEAFKLCRELEIGQVEFEGDAKRIVDAVLSDEVDRGWITW
jgi:hypothetical protein